MAIGTFVAIHNRFNRTAVIGFKIQYSDETNRCDDNVPGINDQVTNAHYCRVVPACQYTEPVPHKDKCSDNKAVKSGDI